MKINNIDKSKAFKSNIRLFNILMKEGITPNSPQIIRWFLITDDKNKARIISEELENICSERAYFSDYSVDMTPLENGSIYVIAKISDFRFTITNLHLFAKKLLNLANKHGVQYDYWEMEYDKFDMKPAVRTDPFGSALSLKFI